MNLKAHLPIAIGVFVIAATQVVCTAWLVERMHRDMPGSSELELRDIGQTLDQIAKSTAALEERSMPTDERLQRALRPQQPEREQYYMLPPPKR